MTTSSSSNNNENNNNDDDDVIVDSIKEEYSRSTQAVNVDRWVSFFNSYQTVNKSEDGTQVNVNRPYINQIKSLSTASPYIYHKEQQQQQQQQRKKGGEIGRVIFEVDYRDLVNARTDLFGIHFSDKHTSNNKKEDKDVRILNIKVLCYQIRNYWDDARSCIKHAVWKLLEIHDKRYAKQIVEDANKIIVVLHNFEINKSIYDISSRDLNKFVRIECLVSQFDDEPSIEVLRTCYKCIGILSESGVECGNTVYQTIRNPPSKCQICEMKDSFVEVPEENTIRDFMYFEVQQTGDSLRIRQTLPTTKNVYVNDMYLVKSVYNVLEVGSLIALNGVIRLAETGTVRDKRTTSSTRTTAEIECVGIELLDEKSRFNKHILNLVEREIPPEMIDEHYDKLVRSFAPHLQGLETAKEILLLQQAAGPSLIQKRGSSRLRGNMNVLLLGDPSLGKSELLNFVVHLNSRSTMVTGKLASAVGLTGSIQRIEIVRGGNRIVRNVINPGPYGSVRGPGAIVCVDDLDKIDDTSVFDALASAKDDYQVVWIHKAMVHQKIAGDCGSLDAANPKSGSGKYDPTMSVFKQTNFPVWFWSRYDYKILFLETKSKESRHLYWEHKGETLKDMIPEDEYYNMDYKEYINDQLDKRGRGGELDSDTYSLDYLVHELAYVREKYRNPELKKGSMAWIMMQDFCDKYKEYSLIPPHEIAENATVNNGGDNKSAEIPAIDNRSENGLIRAAKASARLHRRNEVTVIDMSIAKEKMKETILQFVPHISPDVERQNEVRATEVLLDKALREAIFVQHREQNERVVKLVLGLQKLMAKIHRDYFRPCDVCKGKGVISDKIGYSDDSAKQTMVCNRCHNRKGNYNKIGYSEFEKEAIDTGTYTYAKDYFKWLKDIGTLVKDSGAVTTAVYYRIIASAGTTIISPEMTKMIYQKMHEIFGIDEKQITMQKRLLIEENTSSTKKTG